MSHSETLDALVNIALGASLFALAYPFCTAVHELGHALVGRLVGMRILAFGIGMHSPFFSLRFLGTSFYLAKPGYGGFTFAVDEAIQASAWKQVLLTAGGPLASLLLSGWATFQLFEHGYQSFFTAVAIMAAWDFSVTAFPRYHWMLGSYYPNDAAIIRSFWRHEQHLLMSPGDGLAMCLGTREFFRQLKHVQGEAHYALYTAMAQLEFEDIEGVRHTLDDPILAAPGRGSSGRRLEALVRALVSDFDGAAGENPAICEARVLLKGDEYGLATLELDIASRMFDQGQDAQAQLQLATEHCLATREPHLVSTAEANRLLFVQSSDLADRCRSLLNERGAAELSPTTALSLSSHAAAILAGRGERDSALGFYRDSVVKLREISCRIADQAFRERYVADYSDALKRAMVDQDFSESELAGPTNEEGPISEHQRSPDGLTPLGQFVLVVVAVLLVVIVGIVVLTDMQSMRQSH